MESKNYNYKENGEHLHQRNDSEYFYERIVESLRDEAKELNEKLNTIRKRDDMNLYIATLKSLRETLDLISKYDWRLMYSEYHTTNTCEEKQVSVWEQNHDGQIRNHKIWTIKQDTIKV